MAFGHKRNLRIVRGRSRIDMKRIVSLLPAATEIAAALGLIEQVVGVSHECDYPSAANDRPRVTHSPIHRAGLTSSEIDAWVQQALRENGTIYTIDEPLLRELRPDVILTQKLCDVCAVGYGTVARLAATLPGPPSLVNLDPSSLADIFENIRQVAATCDVPARAGEVVEQLITRLESVRERVANVTHRPCCFLMEWVDPPFCAGHWGPELVEIAGGIDVLGRKHQKSAQIEWQQVLQARPEVIVLALCGYEASRAERDLELLRAYPHFDTLPAARDNRIHIVDANAYFSRPGPRIIDSLELLAGILHPKLFAKHPI
jgi:iron complex transport system substrate-binding protein